MSEALHESVEPTLDRFVSTGQRLKEERERRGLAIEDVATRLSISARYIQALEASEIKALPGPAFIKGYIRAYARYLNLPGDELISNFNRQFGGADAHHVASINKVDRQVKLSDPLMRISLYLFVIAVLGFSIWWWQTQSGSSLSELLGISSNPAELHDSDASDSGALDQPADSAAVTAMVADPTDVQARLAANRQLLSERVAPATAAQGEQQPLAEAPSSSDGADTGEGEPEYLNAEEIQRLAAELERGGDLDTEADELPKAAATKTEIGSPLTPASAAGAEVIAESLKVPGGSEPLISVAQTAASTDGQAAKVTGKLELRFASDCWISIRNASDKLIFANTKRAGETLELDLEVPSSLLIGRVSSVVSARFGGRELELAGVARKDVARLTLNL